MISCVCSLMPVTGVGGRLGLWQSCGWEWLSPMLSGKVCGYAARPSGSRSPLPAVMSRDPVSAVACHFPLRMVLSIAACARRDI